MYAEIIDFTDILTILSAIKKRPALFLGEKSIIRLYDYLSGIKFGWSFYMDLEKDYISDFNKWYKTTDSYKWYAERNPQMINQKYDVWWNYILYKCGGCASYAFDEFFIEFEEFLSEVYNMILSATEKVYLEDIAESDSNSEKFTLKRKFDELEILSDIRKNPDIYIGEKSFTRFMTFTSGLYRAMYNVEHHSYFSKFNDWYMKKYNITDGNGYVIYWNNILYVCEYNQSNAFDRFFNEFEVFLAEVYNKKFP